MATQFIFRPFALPSPLMVVVMKIKNKLVLAFVSVAFIPVSLVALISVLNTRTQAVDQFIDGSTREIRQIDGNIRQFFDASQQNVDQMAADPVYTSVASLKDYQAADAASQPLPEAARQVIEQFARFGKTHPAAAILSIGLEDGTYAKWPDDPQLSKYDPRTRPWYKAAMAHAVTTTGAIEQIGRVGHALHAPRHHATSAAPPSRQHSA